MYGEIPGEDDDPIIQEIPPLDLDLTLPYARSRTSRAQLIPPTSADESSLLIDMPSFHDDSLRHVTGLPASPKRSRSGKELDTRQHPTARTISFDLDEGLKRRKASKSKYFPVSHSSEFGSGGVVKEQGMEKEKARERKEGKRVGRERGIGKEVTYLPRMLKSLRAMTNQCLFLNHGRTRLTPLPLPNNPHLLAPGYQPLRPSPYPIPPFSGQNFAPTMSRTIN